jgi:hypothetical protein
MPLTCSLRFFKLSNPSETWAVTVNNTLFFIYFSQCKLRSHGEYLQMYSQILYKNNILQIHMFSFNTEVPIAIIELILQVVHNLEISLIGMIQPRKENTLTPLHPNSK